jgi:hypothetical protein
MLLRLERHGCIFNASARNPTRRINRGAKFVTLMSSHPRETEQTPVYRLDERIALKSTVETRTSWTEANVFGTCVSYGC